MTESDVLRYFRLLRQHGLNHPTSGNASDRRGITMTGCNVDDYIELVDWDSPFISSDAPIHKFCYDQRPEVEAILHAHSPYAIAGGSFPSMNVRCWFIKADWEAEKQKIAEALVEHGLILHLDHGVYAAAESATEAFEMICSVEHSAKISCLRRLLK